MKQPFDLNRFRKTIKLSFGRQVEPHTRKDEIALRAVLSAQDITDLVDDPKLWCQINVEEGEEWSFRMDKGIDHNTRVPTYWFSNPDTAFLFKLRWSGL